METRFRRRRALAGWAVGVVLATIAMLPLCDLSFDCGCRLPGLGGCVRVTVGAVRESRRMLRALARLSSEDVIRAG